MAKALREKKMTERARAALAHPEIGGMTEGGAFILLMDLRGYFRLAVLDPTRREHIRRILTLVNIPRDRMLERWHSPFYRCTECGIFRQDSDFPIIRKPGRYSCTDLGDKAKKCEGFLAELKVKTVKGLEGFNPTMSP